MGPQVAEPMKQTPMYQQYASIAPKPEDWPVLLTKLGELSGATISRPAAAVPYQGHPAFTVVGDADSVRTAHAVAFFELLGGGKVDAGWDGSGMSNARLAILPAMTHYNIFSSPDNGIRCRTIPRRTHARSQVIGDHKHQNVFVVIGEGNAPPFADHTGVVLYL